MTDFEITNVSTDEQKWTQVVVDFADTFPNKHWDRDQIDIFLELANAVREEAKIPKEYKFTGVDTLKYQVQLSFRKETP